MGVGVMKDETLKRRDLNVSHTLGCKTYSTTVSQVVVYEYRCDERLKTKTEESTRVSDTGLVVELEHLKIKTRLTNEK